MRAEEEELNDLKMFMKTIQNHHQQNSLTLINIHSKAAC
jgi:hypothetical protein